MTNHRPVNVPVANEDPLWYKDAIIYEVHVRAFYDSDGDGIGDFRGLTEKLDYLKDLGVTVLWLLPFYPSPLKDDGYDIADYNGIHPSYGTLRDFKTFMREAARRGLRVITELVVNHTSDQHPWFQRAKEGGRGNRWREYYVWSDSSQKYKDARIIFKDTELSNWTWNAESQAYFWHRFYSHQPDLNYENKQVQRAVMRAMDFWLDMGVSGLRLDAVPYLYESEGTDCENLPRTHDFLREMRSHMDGKFPGRMLLAEANQWPEDAAAYFGDGDECNMNFHFPVMPRMFMAIRMEDRYPIVDILEQTPEIPENSQWAMFLRNHDELTLEMVTDEERDYMYRVYAHDNQMRINLGIRRRLAPLLNNDRRKIELLNGLLFSMPGTPVIYYGDEIGMGDNFYLGDRNGVRTPMQWSPDRNAGFSKANPQSLYFPVIIDPEYNYESVNVESQNNNSDSLLWWMKRFIALRKRYKAFGRGSIRFLNPENRKVLAFIREYEGDTILVVANLSRQAQHAFLDLADFTNRTPVELSGDTRFPVVREDAYPITLSPYAFYWFSLEAQPEEETLYSAASEEIPTFALSPRIDDPFREEYRSALESILLGYVRRCRWFGGKARHIQSSNIQDIIPITYRQATTHLILMRIDYADGEPDTYILPITCEPWNDAHEVIEEFPNSVLARLTYTGRSEHSDKILYDATADESFSNAMLQVIGGRRTFRGEHGEITGSSTRAFRRLRGPANIQLDCKPIRTEQSNTSVMYEDKLVLKLFRRASEGVNPDLEIGRFLTERVSFQNTAPVAGALEYHRRRNDVPVTVAILQGFVPNQGDAWTYTIDSLGQYFEWALAHPEVDVPSAGGRSLLDLSEEDSPELSRDIMGFYLHSASIMGQRTAELHTALASSRNNADFQPESFSDLYRRSLYQSMRNLTNEVFRTLRRQRNNLAEEVQEEADRVIGLRDDILERFRKVLDMRITAMRTRVHGDYHLGQVLYTGSDFVIIDFEGEPARAISERRLKRSPLRDVAGMLRSYHYAANAAMFGQASTVLRPDDLPHVGRWARYWYQWASASFLRSYLEIASESAFLPANRDELSALLEIYLLEKAMYEVNYELNNRPEWVRVPIQGVLQLMGAETM